MQKMMKWSDSTYENVKKMFNNLFGLVQKVDAHAVSIKPFEKNMNQLSTTVNPCYPIILPSNTIKNPKNDAHCMVVTTQGGKKTIDTPMFSEVEVEVSKDDDVIEVTGESQNAIERKWT